jgi:hypothetical protein
MKNGVKYGTDEAFEVLEPYMQAYGRALEFATTGRIAWGLSRSLGATAIAPTAQSASSPNHAFGRSDVLGRRNAPGEERAPLGQGHLRHTSSLILWPRAW